MKKLGLLFFAFIISPAFAADWPQWLGSNRNGTSAETGLLTTWPKSGPKVLWTHPGGEGYSSIAIAGGKAITQVQHDGAEFVLALDAAKGTKLWETKVAAGFKNSYGNGPRATPTVDGKLVYAQSPSGALTCLDSEKGDIVWSVNLLKEFGAKNISWGMSSSPLIVDDTVVTIPGGSRGRSLIAYNRLTGTRAWSAGDDGQSYSSPMLVTLDGVRQILNVSAKRIMGLNPANGAVLWEFPWVTMYDVNAGQPIVVGDNRVFMSSGYDHGAVVLEIDMNGTRGSVKEIWQNNRMKNQFASSHFHNGFIYGLDDGILACVDANTGERKWKAGRYGHGQTVLVDGHLIIVTEEGDLALVRATPDKHDELARFPVLDGKTWNHPAFSDGRLLVRNISTMAMFDLRK